MLSRAAFLPALAPALAALALSACASSSALRRATPAAPTAPGATLELLPSAGAPGSSPRAQAQAEPAARAAALVALPAEGLEAAEELEPSDLADNETIEEEERRLYLREGAFPTRELALAIGARVVSATAVDVDLDGRADEILDVTPASSPLAREACVLARNTEGGWRTELLDSNIGSLSQLLECGAPIRAGSVVFLRTTMIHDPGREFGPGADRTEAFYVAAPSSPAVIVGYVETAAAARGPLQIEAAGDGILRLVARGGREARVTWDPGLGRASVSDWFAPAP